jgi:hypothetical protein
VLHIIINNLVLMVWVYYNNMIIVFKDYYKNSLKMIELLEGYNWYNCFYDKKFNL